MLNSHKNKSIGKKEEKTQFFVTFLETEYKNLLLSLDL